MIGAVLELARQQAWALDRRVLASFESILLRRCEDGVKLPRAEIEAALAAAGQPPTRGRDELVIEQGGIGVVPIRGVIARRASMFDDVSPGRGTSVEKVQALLQKAANDSAVRGVLLDIDSPGGTVAGIPELAAEIRDFESVTGKPVWALADGTMASAAFWLASGAHSVFATPSANVGSIGVYTVLQDLHRAADAQGVEVHVVSTGPHKGAGEPGTRITRAHLDGAQEQVDDIFALFKRDVAQGRALPEHLMAAVCDGQCWIAHQARERGLVDEVATRAHVLREFRATLGGDAPKTTAANTAVRGNQSSVAARAEASPMTEPKIETVEQLRAAHPQLVEQLVAELRSSAATAQTAAVDQAVATERARAARILKNSTPSQTQLAAELIGKGADVADALEALSADPRRNVTALLQHELATAAPAINGSAPPVVGTPAAETREEKAKRMAKEQWATDPHTRDLYGTEANLAALLLAQARGVSCVRG